MTDNFERLARDRGFSQEWVEQRRQGRARLAEEKAENERREKSPAQLVAEHLGHTISTTHVNYVDVPKRNPLKTLSDDEWFEVYSALQKRRRSSAEWRLEECIKHAKKVTKEFKWTERLAGHAEVGELSRYAGQLRQAADLFSRLADGLEREVNDD